MSTLRAVAITMIVIIVGMLALSYGFLRSEGLSARRKPGDFEYTVANYALALSIPSETKNLRNPVNLNPEVLIDAKKSYSENCAVCHGIDGTGKTDIARGLSPEVPDIRAPTYKAGRTASCSTLSRQAFVSLECQAGISVTSKFGIWYC